MQAPDGTGALAASKTLSEIGVDIRRVSKAYGDHAILAEIDLAVNSGQFICLLGPSGCGKTTLLRCIAGLDAPDRGRIALYGQPVVDRERGLFVTPDRRGLGMVFQHYALWPHMSVYSNIAYPLRKRGIPAQSHRTKILDLARLVGLENILDRRPSQLSGGQQQRVALARALAGDPKILLLDEPLSNLDATLRVQLRRELRNIHNRLGMTTVLVTHDQDEAAALADVIAVMQGGKIVQIGPPDEVLGLPNSRYVAAFIGYDNFVPGTVARTEGRRATIRVHDDASIVVDVMAELSAGTEVMIAARGESLRIHRMIDAPATATFRAEIARITRLGHSQECELSCGSALITITSAASQSGAHCAGETVVVEWPHDSAVFSADGLRRF